MSKRRMIMLSLHLRRYRKQLIKKKQMQIIWRLIIPPKLLLMVPRLRMLRSSL
jgi:hypothetical protein